jgi:hypothetical protein
MPVHDFVHWTQQGGGTLAADGPLIPVEVGIPTALEQWCIANNSPIPPPVTGFALIDTGASISGVHEPLLQQMNVQPVDSIPLSTPSGVGRCSIYPARLSLPALNVTNVPVRLTGNQLNWTASDGKNVIMLLGRDILYQFLLVYNGKMNSITLAF